MTARAEAEMVAASESSRSICFVHTSPAMLHLLEDAGPDAMGGAELQMYLLGRELQRRGWKVTYLVGDYGGAPLAETAEGLRVEVAHRPDDRRPLVGSAQALVQFWRAIRRVDADVYVTRGLTAQTGVVTAFARSLGRRSVFWFGKDADARFAVPRVSGLPVKERAPAWFGMRFCSEVVCQTEQQLALLDRYTGRTGVMIRNIAPWTDVPHAAGGQDRALWVGSMQPKKRPEMLLQVAERLPEITFAMAGGRMKRHPGLYDVTEERARRLPNVEFLGFVPHEEIREQFLAADMLVSTSEPAREGFPNVFLQAWSAGLPVVTTCDPDGIIASHGLGSACESTDDLTESILTLSADTDLRAEIGHRARAWVRTHHSPEQVGGRLENVLESLLLDCDAGPD